MKAILGARHSNEHKIKILLQVINNAEYIEEYKNK